MWNQENSSSNLDINMTLEAFLLDTLNKDNKFIEFYKRFINTQNEILRPLLYKKINLAIFKEKDKEEIPIQKATENEILTFNLEYKYQTFNNLILNYSQRNIFNLSNNSINYNNYIEYSKNFEKIEEILTNLFLSNKKLFTNEINGVIYKNDKYFNSILSKFRDNKRQIGLNQDDKNKIFILYTKEFKGNLKNSLLFLKEIEKIINFINENNIKENSVKKIITNSFGKLNDLNFVNKKIDTFNVDQLYNILLLFEMLIFEEIKNKLINTQQKLTKEDISKINQYFKKNDSNDDKIEIIKEKKNYCITKEKMSIALRRLMTRFIIKIIIFEEDEETIKESLDNIVKYLISPDLWDNKDNYQKDNEILNKEIILFNIHLNKVLDFYEYLNAEKLDLEFIKANDKTVSKDDNRENPYPNYFTRV